MTIYVCVCLTCSRYTPICRWQIDAYLSHRQQSWTFDNFIHISTIEKCQSSPHGYALRRGILWRTAFAIECKRRNPSEEFSKFVRLQSQPPYSQRCVLLWSCIIRIHKTRNSPGALIKAPPVDRGLLKSLQHGRRGGSWRPTNWIRRVNKKFRGKPHTFRGIIISPFGRAWANW